MVSKMGAVQAHLPAATRIIDCWVMDVMTDELFDGRRIPLLTSVDRFARESLATDARA
ncbi:hypothetical protein AB1K70_04775 [Bremerella sp. JC770]|uniref:hypothetical protein n=1 Tax=Bremerella sp. JC770 TaxID=3232137 RepID=UPI00345A98EA